MSRGRNPTLVTTEPPAVRPEFGVQGAHVVVDQMSKTNTILTHVDSLTRRETGIQEEMKWIVEHNFDEFNYMNIVGRARPKFFGDPKESRNAISFLTCPKK